MSDPSPVPGRSREEDDILLAVGGQFSPRSLGPQAYEEVRGRIRARPADYLRVFESMFMGTAFDPVTESALLFPVFLELVADQEPAAVRDLAQRLIRQFDAVLAFYDAASDREALHALVPDETIRMAQRLDARRMELQPLAEEPA